MFAAMTHPTLTCHVFEGRLRRPMALAVRTPLVSTTGVFAVDHVDVLGVMAARGALCPGVRDRPPVSRSASVISAACRSPCTHKAHASPARLTTKPQLTAIGKSPAGSTAYQR